MVGRRRAGDADGAEVRAQRAIVAVPATLAGRIAYDPPLPGYRDQLTQRVPMGAVIKCFAIYDEPFWRAEGMSGSTVSGSGPLTLTVDNSPPAGSPGSSSASSRAITRARSAACRRTSGAPRCSPTWCSCWARARGARTTSSRSWAEEEWSRGCYEGYTPPGVLTAFGPALREPIGPIHWAGTETATKWNGYIDGASAVWRTRGARGARRFPAAPAAAYRRRPL